MKSIQIMLCVPLFQLHAFSCNCNEYLTTAKGKEKKTSYFLKKSRPHIDEG